MDTVAQPAIAFQTVAPAAATAASDAADAATDFETFLTLLTAQLRNQDPLQPIDSTQFVAQLASFSSVEQQVKSNALLSEISMSLAGNAPERLVGLIGHEVPAPVLATFNNAPVDIRFHPVPGASEATLIIRDGTGTIVNRLQIDPAGGAASWDGTLPGGHAAPGSEFAFEVESADASGVISNQPGLVFAPVTQIRFDGPEPLLGFANGAEVALSEVIQVRAPNG